MRQVTVTDEQLAREKLVAAEELAHDMDVLKECYDEVDRLVGEQAPLIKEAERNLSQAHDDIKEGIKPLQKARKRKNSRRKWAMFLGAVVVVVVVVVIIVLVA